MTELTYKCRDGDTESIKFNCKDLVAMRWIVSESYSTLILDIKGLGYNYPICLETTDRGSIETLKRFYNEFNYYN